MQRGKAPAESKNRPNRNLFGQFWFSSVPRRGRSSFQAPRAACAFQPAGVQLAYVQRTETADEINDILTAHGGVLHFLLDDLKLNVLFSFFQFIKPLLGRGIDNPQLNSVKHIGDAALGFFQLLAEGGEHTAFPALNIHHGIRHILYKIIVHDFCHDRIDNGIFQRQLSDGLVLGVTGAVLLGIYTAVIMILPALAGACSAFAYHHSPESAAKQLCCQ